VAPGQRKSYVIHIRMGDGTARERTKYKGANLTCNSSDADHCLLPGCHSALPCHMPLAITAKGKYKKNTSTNYRHARKTRLDYTHLAVSAPVHQAATAGAADDVVVPQP